MSRNARLRCSPFAQRGAGAILMLMFVLVLGASSVALSLYTPRASNPAGDDVKTADALAKAKEALIGYAVRRGVNTCSDPSNVALCQAQLLQRPGELPCPDTNNDGIEEASCNAGAIGRLPWKTLGMPEPKDSAGETLWYAVAGTVRPWLAVDPARRINSDTRGNLVVRAADGVQQLTTEAAAVIFAPGSALGAQNRAPGELAACPTGGTVARNLCAANYLDASNGTNNANTAGVFIAGTRGTSFNDRVLYIRTADYIHAVEMRVGSELKSLLAAYRANSACKCYPWADSWLYSGGVADVHMNRGRFPSRAYPENWGEGAIPSLPQWVTDNDWHNRVWYSAGRQETDGGGTKCLFCTTSNALSVDGSAVSALLFTVGPAPAGINRGATLNVNNLAYYLDDEQNNDKGTCPGWTNENGGQTLNILPPPVPAGCDVYVRPTATALTRDRVFTVSTTPGSQCAPAARGLAQAVTIDPCHTTGDNVREECTTLVNALSSCGCAPAAQTMIEEPCRNTLNPPQCQAALTQLLTCGS